MQTSSDIGAHVGASLCSLVDDTYTLLQKAEAMDVVGIDKSSEYIHRDKAIIWSHCENGVTALRLATELLPRFGKAFDKALSTDVEFEQHSYIECELTLSQPGTHAPWRFMGPLVEYVFSHGEVDTKVSALIVKAIRQISYLMYKYERPFTKAQLAKASDTFVENDRVCGIPMNFHGPSEEIKELSKNGSLLPGLRLSDVLSEMQCITGSIFNLFDPWDIIPKHGPGAVSTGERGVQKLNVGFRDNPKLLNTYDISYFTTMPNGMFDLLERTKCQQLSKMKCDTGRNSKVPTTKVVFVPKDSRGPRVISCEPLENMYIQQGLGRAIMAHLENHRLIQGRINFTYQDINRDIALRSSISGDYVTLDLKDASDLVRNDLVQALFEHVPNLLRCINAVRSEQAKLPDGRVVALNKFAPMGSALCFPIESYVFWVICVAVIRLSTRISVREAAKAVYVYGDDIACLSAYHRLIGAFLEEFGLKLNRSKCCYGRFFRESCGMDAYKGINVSPARWRKPIPSSHHDVSALFSLAALSNGLYERGFATSADYFANLLYRIEPLTLRLTAPVSGLLAIIRPYHTDEFSLGRRRKRFNRRLQRLELLGVVATPLTFEYSGGGWSQVAHGIVNLCLNHSYGESENPMRECGSVTSYPFAIRTRRNIAWRPCR